MSPADAIPPPAEPEEGLSRSLGLFSTTMLVMGGIIGAGIFFAPARVAIQQPATLGILLTWALGGVLALTGAIVFAELGGLFSRSGGQYVYLREGLGRTVAFIFGWSLLSIVNSGAIAVVAGFSALNLELVLDALLGRRGTLGASGQMLFAAALVIALTWVNVRGVRLGASVHNVFMVLKIACILLLIALGLAHWSSGGAPRTVVAPDTDPVRWSTLSLALLSVLFTYGGWNNAASVAGEIRDVQRTLPRAVLLGTIAVVALYVGLNLSLLAILGAPGLAAESSPVAAAAGAVLGEAAGAFVAFAIVLSTIGVTHALLLMAPRVFFAMARDGIFLSAFGRVHPRYATPHVSILVLSGFTLFYLTQDAGAVLDGLVVFDWIFFTLTGIAFFVFRWKRPELPRPYRASGYPLVPAIFVLLAAAIVVATAEKLGATDPMVLLVPGSIFGAGLLVHLLQRARASSS
jgi:APA family basic amino acid/polyamine antiporter